MAIRTDGYHTLIRGFSPPDHIRCGLASLCGTILPSDIPVGLTDEFAEVWAAQWRAFLGRDRMAAAPEAFAVTIADLRVFLMPLVVGPDHQRVWQPSGPWSPRAEFDEA